MNSVVHKENQMKPAVYKAKYPIRFVTASSLFDGHDASINIVRRILQASGAEVIHLGHNRSVGEIVTAAIQEDVQELRFPPIKAAISSFKYMYDLLQEKGASHIRILAAAAGSFCRRKSGARTI